jgi:hypothetical protein
MESIQIINFGNKIGFKFVELEKYDNDKNIDGFKSIYERHPYFTLLTWYHILMTTPIFGTWNYHDHMKSYISHHPIFNQYLTLDKLTHLLKEIINQN